MLTAQGATPADKYILDLAQCSTRFAVFQSDTGLAVHPLRCRKRACPICQGSARARWRERLALLKSRMTAPKHLTLNPRSTHEPLRVQIDRLYKSFRRLRQRAEWKRRHPWGYFVLEITYNAEKGTFHPHLHVLVDMAFLHKDILHEAWLSITGDSVMTSIDAVKGNVGAELEKYIQKSQAVWTCPIDPYVLNAELKGLRLVQPFGHFPDMPKPIPRPLIFIGSVRTIMRQAARGKSWALGLADWLVKTAPHAVLAELYHLGPPGTSQEHPNG